MATVGPATGTIAAVSPYKGTLPVLLFLVACSGGDERVDHDGGAPPVSTAPPTQPWQSGTRLRARVVGDQRGARMFVGWHDDQLDVDCHFRLAQDGVWRCLPAVVLGRNDVLHADAACQLPVSLNPIVVRNVPATYVQVAPSFDADRRSPRCAPDDTRTANGVFRVGAPAASPAATAHWAMRESGGETCSEVPVAGQPLTALEAVPLDTFVRARVQQVAGSPGARWLRADDGAVEVQSLVLGNGELCDLLAMPAAHGDPMCVTVHAQPLVQQPTTGVVYADATCTTPTSTSARPEFGGFIWPCGDASSLVIKQASCVIDGAITRPAPQIAAGSYSEGVHSSVMVVGGGMVCTRDNDRGTLLPSPAPPGGHAQVELRTEGEGRLRARFATSAGGIPARNPDRVRGLREGAYPDLTSPFHDTARDEPCTPTVSADGLRCLPHGERIENVSAYADPACQVPGIETNADLCFSDNQLIDARRGTGATAVDYVRAVIRPTGAPPQATRYEKQGVDCVQVNRGDGSLLLPAEQVDATAYARLAEARE